MAKNSQSLAKCAKCNGTQEFLMKCIRYECKNDIKFCHNCFENHDKEHCKNDYNLMASNVEMTIKKAKLLNSSINDVVKDLKKWTNDNKLSDPSIKFSIYDNLISLIAEYHRKQAAFIPKLQELMKFFEWQYPNEKSNFTKLRRKLSYLLKDLKCYESRLIPLYKYIKFEQHNIRTKSKNIIAKYSSLSGYLFLFDFILKFVCICSFRENGNVPIPASGIVQKFHAATIQINSNFYIIGGDNGAAASKMTHKVCLYDPRLLVIKLSNLNQGRFNTTVVQIQNKFIYAIAGTCYNQKNKAGILLRSCERYDIQIDKWTIISSLNIPRHQTCACTFNDRYIYIIGIYYGNHQPHSDFFEMYDSLDDASGWKHIYGLIRSEVFLMDFPKAYIRQISDSEILFMNCNTTEKRIKLSPNGNIYNILNRTNNTTYADELKSAILYKNYIIYYETTNIQHLTFYNYKTGISKNINVIQVSQNPH